VLKCCYGAFGIEVGIPTFVPTFFHVWTSWFTQISLVCGDKCCALMRSSWTGFPLFKNYTILGVYFYDYLWSKLTLHKSWKSPQVDHNPSSDSTSACHQLSPYRLWREPLRFGTLMRTYCIPDSEKLSCDVPMGVFRKTGGSNSMGGADSKRGRTMIKRLG